MNEMTDPATLRPVTTVRALCEAAEEHGVSTASCLANTQLSAADLRSPTKQVSISQEIRAIENFARASGNAVGLGVWVGKKLHSNAFGIWGFAILTSPTLRSAIETAIEYAKLSFAIADLRVRETGERAGLEFDMTDLPAITHRYVLERHAYVTMTFVRELVQESDLEAFAIETRDPDLDYAKALSDLLNLTVDGSAAQNAVTFPADLLDRSLPKSDPATLQFCLQQCKAILEQAGGALPLWSKRVRDAVVDDISEEQKIETVAEKLAVTERTLRRRLTDEGTSYRELYTDARMTIARELLETAGLNVEAVAWRVGYSEPASFVRAFSKKFGKTPGEIRKPRA